LANIEGLLLFHKKRDKRVQRITRINELNGWAEYILLVGPSKYN